MSIYTAFQPTRQKRVLVSALLVGVLLFAQPATAFAAGLLQSVVAKLLAQRQQAQQEAQASAAAAGAINSASAIGSGGLGIGKPFGGRILVYIPCINGAAYIVLGPPSPGSYVYQLGVSRSYMAGPPSHLGQFLLGMAAPGGVCTHGVDVLYGSFILYTGSSLFGPTFAPSTPVKNDPLCC